MYKIYVLIDPFTWEIRYVGQTCKKLNTRLLQHTQKFNIREEHTYKSRWIRKMIEAGETPDIFQIDEADSPEELDELETKYILEFSRLGYNLVNSQIGGYNRLSIQQYNRKMIRRDSKGNEFWYISPNHIEDSFDRSAIHKCIKGSNKFNTHKGYSWRFSDTDYIEREDGRSKQKRPVIGICMETGDIVNYCSAKQAALDLEGSRGNVTLCCQGKKNSYKGYYWKYKEVL